MKKQQLREFIKKFIKEMINEASRSTVKKGSKLKTKDQFGRNITRYTAVSKKGRETPMIQYDDPDPKKKNDQCILKDFDWGSVKIEGYHYEEDSKTNVIVYNNALIIQYKKDDSSFKIPIKSLKQPDKTKDEATVIIVSTSKADKISTCEKGVFSRKTCQIYAPSSIKDKLLDKWTNRDTTKTKNCDNVYDKSDLQKYRLDKEKEDKKKKSVFGGDTKLSLNKGPDHQTP